MSENLEDELIEMAKKAREKAYALYSRRYPGKDEDIHWGAALVTRSGKMYAGCNIEEPGLILTRHAEMMAVDRMVFGRENDEDDITIDTLVIFGDPGSIGKDEPVVFPCHLCRHYMLGYTDENTILIAVSVDGSKEYLDIDDLTPRPPFG